MSGIPVVSGITVIYVRGDQFVDSYIHGWKDGVLSYERDGDSEGYFNDLVEQVRSGRSYSGLVN